MCDFIQFWRRDKIASNKSREENDKQNWMSTRTEPSDVSDSVSYQTETNSSSSGRSTVSEISSTVVDQPNSQSKVTEKWRQINQDIALNVNATVIVIAIALITAAVDE